MTLNFELEGTESTLEPFHSFSAQPSVLTVSEPPQGGNPAAGWTQRHLGIGAAVF